MNRQQLFLGLALLIHACGSVSAGPTDSGEGSVQDPASGGGAEFDAAGSQRDATTNSDGGDVEVDAAGELNVDGGVTELDVADASQRDATTNIEDGAVEVDAAGNTSRRDATTDGGGDAGLREVCGDDVDNDGDGQEEEGCPNPKNATFWTICPDGSDSRPWYQDCDRDGEGTVNKTVYSCFAPEPIGSCGWARKWTFKGSTHPDGSPLSVVE